MPLPPEPPQHNWPRLWLRRTDQATVVGCTVVALAALLGHWMFHGGHRGRMIEVDRVKPGAIAFTVDVNQAEWPELTVLPGVGETLAKRIVDSRRREGPFRDVDDLRRIRGIGPLTLQRITPYLQPIPDLDSTAGEQRGRKDS